MGNISGHYFRVATFGESHGPAMGLIIDGLPAGVRIEENQIQLELNRRKPGNSPFVSPRKEDDQIEILSGLTDNLTNGAPLAMIARNVNQKPKDYSAINKMFRPGHADWTYYKKYGLEPQSGGGRSSGRETLSRVAAGAVARMLLKPLGITVSAATLSVGPIKSLRFDWDFAYGDPLLFLDPDLAIQAHQFVLSKHKLGDSVGAVIELKAEGVPAGWGDPVFDKLNARLGGAFFSIGAVKAVEFGQGLTLAQMLGSEANDPMGPSGPTTNNHGGILGGISTGRPIRARLFIKPTPSIAIEQKTIDLNQQNATIKVHGRHDPCLAPRLAPVAEAMCLITLADFFLAPPSRL
ncbi:MAG: chorismate synthase [Deltaproteobacteria bacterium]|jgi:chorismate synthase|nr:chorismate synthase [Deltaproteobacteria bacterium]